VKKGNGLLQHFSGELIFFHQLKTITKAEYIKIRC